MCIWYFVQMQSFLESNHLQIHLIGFQLASHNLLLNSRYFILWILQLIHLLSAVFFIIFIFFSSEQPLHPTDTPQTHYDALIFLALYFSIYTHWDEQWAPGSPHSPARAHVDTQTHFLSGTHTHMLWVEAEVEVRGFHQQCVWPYELMWCS